jgi:hypothetical protein
MPYLVLIPTEDLLRVRGPTPLTLPRAHIETNPIDNFSLAVQWEGKNGHINQKLPTPPHYISDHPNLLTPQTAFFSSHSFPTRPSTILKLSEQLATCTYGFINVSRRAMGKYPRRL